MCEYHTITCTITLKSPVMISKNTKFWRLAPSQFNPTTKHVNIILTLPPLNAETDDDSHVLNTFLQMVWAALWLTCMQCCILNYPLTHPLFHDNIQLRSSFCFSTHTIEGNSGTPTQIITSITILFGEMYAMCFKYPRVWCNRAVMQ